MRDLRQVMSQADFMREYDVNAHKINSLKYYPNALMKDKEGKVAAKIKSRIAMHGRSASLSRGSPLTGNNVNIRLSNSRGLPRTSRCSMTSERDGRTPTWRTSSIQAIRADGIVGDVAATSSCQRKGRDGECSRSWTETPLSLSTTP